jgi:hypothetical protein
MIGKHIKFAELGYAEVSYSDFMCFGTAITHETQGGPFENQRNFYKFYFKFYKKPSKLFQKSYNY